jgi:hypothetical protein
MTVIQFPVRGLRLFKAKKSNSLPQKTTRNTRTYLEVRDREYLFEEEVKAMIQVAPNKGLKCYFAASVSFAISGPTCGS